MAAETKNDDVDALANGVSTLQLPPPLTGLVKKNYNQQTRRTTSIFVVADDGGVWPFGSVPPTARGIFAHYSAFQQDTSIVQTGRRVTYDMGEHNGRECAVNINLAPIPAGYDEWLRGETGWDYGGLLADQNDMRIPHSYRGLVVLAIEKLRKQNKAVIGKYAAQRDKAAGKLFYQSPGQGKTELWSRKTSEYDIPGAVFGVRKLVVDRLYSLLDTEDAAQTYLRVDPLRGDDRGRQWGRLASLVRSLSRGGRSGPDAPLQWSGHDLRNNAPWTLVTEASMLEMVVKLGSILDLLFAGRVVPDGVSVRAIKFAFRAALAAPSIDPAKIRWVRDTWADRRQKHTNPSDVFEALLAAWEMIPIESDDVKEHILSWLLNGLNYAAPALFSVMSYLDVRP